MECVCGNILSEKDTGCECGAVKVKSHVPTDTEMLDWLAENCFYPGECPDDGVFVCVSESLAPHLSFIGSNPHDARVLREAIQKAMRG